MVPLAVRLVVEASAKLISSVNLNDLGSLVWCLLISKDVFVTILRSKPMHRGLFRTQLNI